MLEPAVLDCACMESHLPAECGKVQLDDSVLSCLKVFFILCGGFLLHRSEVSRKDLESGEVPGSCFNPTRPQACPGEVLLMQTPSTKRIRTSHTSSELSS